LKKVLITGITKGIGLAIAQRFAQDSNYHIIGCARTAYDLEALAKQYPQFSLYRCDLAHKQELQKTIAQILAAYPEIDILVNNAGRFIQAEIHQEDDEIFETLMYTNLFSAYYLSKAVVPGMRAQGGGTIVNICSTASLKAYLKGGSYCVSKFGLLGLSKVMRQELIPYNIRVIAVLPGATLTPSWQGTTLPSERFMQPEDVAEMVWAACQLPANCVIEEITLRPLQGDLD
jgi:NADP-dependent 3-hydroxy acid dehydrogenase YdfG